MSLYRKKPVVTEARQFTQADIEAYLFDKEPLPLGVRLAGASYHPERRTINHAHFTVETLHGRVSAVAGDWILPEPEAGKSYPVTDAVFRETYEPVAARRSRPGQGERPMTEREKALEEALHEAVEALDDLTDVQNGPPLISYTDDWNAAMSRALSAIQQGRALAAAPAEGAPGCGRMVPDGETGLRCNWHASGEHQSRAFKAVMTDEIVRRMPLAASPAQNTKEDHHG